MPFMTNGKRDYAKEANWEKTKARHRIKDRRNRVAARRAVEKKLGKNLPSSKHVDHKKELIRGGSNAASNLRVVSAKINLSKEARRKKANA